MSAASVELEHYDPGSFRDQQGRVFFRDGGVFRGLNHQALTAWERLQATDFFPRLVREGKIIPTEQISAEKIPAESFARNYSAVLQHERLPFISYVYEWCFGMLRDAALLQLELLQEALAEGMILKDASPYNMQWRGAKPVFIDIPSFVPLEPGSAWVGYRQFCQLYLYPLLLQAYKRLPFQPWLRGCIDGIEPEHCLQMMSARDLLRRGVFSHVFLHARFQSRFGDSDRDIKSQLRSAGFNAELIQANLRGLAKTVRKLQWNPPGSEWADYANDNSYDDTDRRLKQEFVEQVARQRHWKLAWDLGANTGTFARLVSRHAEFVVALDKDALAVERFYRALRAEGQTTILPIVGDLADPSVNRGWRGIERKAFTNREPPQLVLFLALIHHLVITANIPMRDLVQWLAGLGADLVIEFVTRDDPMVQKLLRNKDEPHDDYRLENFERFAAEFFHVRARRELTSASRVLYHLKPRIPATSS